MLEIHNSFNIFMQTLNVNDVSQVRVNSRNLGFTQTWENNTKSPCAKEECDSLVLSRSDLWMIWKMSCYSACLLLLFLFRTNDKKGHLDENGFRHYYGNVFRKWHSESYLITAMFKVPSQELRGTLTTVFWKIPYSSLFYGHGSTCMLNLSSRLR